MAVYTTVYDPKEVRLIVAGKDVTGFADGDKIKIDPVTKDLYKTHVGVNGDVSYSKVNDDRHSLTASIKQGSPSNIILEGLMKLGQSFPVSIMNSADGKYLGVATNCRIMERPSVSFGADSGKREWKIMMPNYNGTALPEENQ